MYTTHVCRLRSFSSQVPVLLDAADVCPGHTLVEKEMYTRMRAYLHIQPFSIPSEFLLDTNHTAKRRSDRWRGAGKDHWADSRQVTGTSVHGGDVQV